MKKVLFAVCLLIISNCVQASVISNYSIVCQKDGVVEEQNLELKDFNGLKAFTISPNAEYQILDKALINNLVYLGINNEDGLYQATIQMLIWENTTSDYEYFIKDKNGKEIDVDMIVKKIESELQEFNKISNLDGNYYEVEYGEILTITDQIDLGNYQNDKFSSINNGNSITLSNFNKIGFFEIEFNNNLNIYESLVYALSPAYKPFVIYINVLGQTLNFNVTTPNDYPYYLTFEIFDLDNTCLGKFTIDENNNEFYYKKGLNIKIKEITEYPIYNLEPTITIMANESLIHNIDIYKEALEFEITIKTKYVKYLYSPDSFDTYTDVSIYDANFNYITTCKSEEECLVTLKSGKYFFKDNLTNETYSYDVLDNNEIEIDRFLIRGIIINEKVALASSEYELENKNDNIYLFKEPLIPNKYVFLIDNELINIDFTNQKNYIYINDYGVFYKLNLDNNKIIINDEKNNLDKEIKINVPDTQINYTFDWRYIDDKKNYKNIIYYISNIY